MKVWVDPKETSGDRWGVLSDERRASGAPTPATPAIDRAVAATPPIQYADGAFVTPTVDEHPAVADGYARVEFNCAVTRPGRLKLVIRGYHWDGDGAGRRFKSLLSREAPPTDTLPFDTYDRWLRDQRGEVVGYEEGDEYIDFRPDGDSTKERRDQRDWETLWRSVRLRLVELELVRNAPFARYLLRERGRWDEFRGVLRWKPTAFGDAGT
ncbi:MAG: hypothetical protein ABEI80_10350 [Haloplanus sp.]